MNTAEYQGIEQHDKGEDDLRTTTESLQLSPIAPEGNEGCSNTTNDEIKIGAPDNDGTAEKLQKAGNTVQPNVNEITGTLPELPQILPEGNHNHLEPNDVVKKEPVSDICYDMTIHKTTLCTSAAQGVLHTDMEINTPENGDENEKYAQMQTAANTDHLKACETIEKLPEPPQISANNEQNTSGLHGVRVKEEPVSEEMDYNMPIAKTLHHASATQYAQHSGVESSTLLHTNANSTHLDNSSSKSALDAYLDGIVTPIAPVMPRLRVKTEFIMQKTPPCVPSPKKYFLNKDSEAMNTEFLPPPPPPVFSSNCNSDVVADGIATPRLSLAAINRANIKTEFPLPPSTPPQHDNEEPFSFPEGYFDDLLVKREAGEISPSISDDDSAGGSIPDDFFDDLLCDQLKEKIKETENNAMEVKYSDFLKERERLKRELKAAEKNLKERRKKRKKQKKSKKKSRKRSRDRSLSPSSKKERSFDDSLHLYNYDMNKRKRMSPPRKEMPSCSNYINREAMEENYLPVTAGFKIKTECPVNDFKNISKESALAVENVEEIKEVLTPKQRRERAINRAAAVLNQLKESSGGVNSNIFSSFPFVSNVRKLPTSHSNIRHKIYENRSPLHTVNNVSYKFNSLTTSFNMEEWGLAALPTHAAKLAKLVGCDAQFIHDKLKTIKIPAKLKKIKQKNHEPEENEETEELIETTSSLYSNAMTQTDEYSECNRLLKAKGYEIGVQVEPSMYSIGCQTLETQSPTEGLHRHDEAPIMKIIHDLNENQLMAIHAFAELIKEPNTNANAMDMYKIQMKILDIYKMSQIPSALVTSQNAIINNYTTKTTKHIAQPQLTIQSVKSADGRQFSVNDPRAKSAAYTKRIVNDDAGPSSNYGDRYSQPSHSRSSSNDGYSQSSYSRSSGSEARHYSSSSNNSPSSRQRPNPMYKNPSPPTTTKRYGRGALRR